MTSPEAGAAARDSHRSQKPLHTARHLNLKGGSQDAMSTRGCRREGGPSFGGGEGVGREKLAFNENAHKGQSLDRNNRTVCSGEAVICLSL